MQMEEHTPEPHQQEPSYTPRVNVYSRNQSASSYSHSQGLSFRHSHHEGSDSDRELDDGDRTSDHDRNRRDHDHDHDAIKVSLNSNLKPRPPTEFRISKESDTRSGALLRLPAMAMPTRDPYNHSSNQYDHRHQHHQPPFKHKTGGPVSSPLQPQDQDHDHDQKDLQDRSPPPPTSSSSSAPPTKPPSRQYHYKRRQRYLQEDDRIMIIRRIEAGEKQSDLAKEYQVTRAAICNTFKNRHDILRRSGLLAATVAGTSNNASTNNSGANAGAEADGDENATSCAPAKEQQQQQQDEDDEDEEASAEEEEDREPRTMMRSSVSASVLETPQEAMPMVTSAPHHRPSTLAPPRPSFAMPSMTTTTTPQHPSPSQQQQQQVPSSFLKRPHSEIYSTPGFRSDRRLNGTGGNQYRHQPQGQEQQQQQQEEVTSAVSPDHAEQFGRRSQRSRITRKEPCRTSNGVSPRSDRQYAELEAMMVHEIRTPAMVNLMTCLRDRDISHRLFRHTADRVMRMLVEDALGHSPMVRTVVLPPSGRPIEGLMTQFETCSVGLSKTSYPLMQCLQSILPNVKSGFVDVVRRRHQSRWYLQVAQASLPARLHDHYVLLLDTTCATGDAVVEAIQVLLRAGCSEDRICFVCVIASAEAVAFISSRVPKVKLLVAALDPEVDAHQRILPGCGDFVARYYGMDQNHRQY